MKSRTLQGGGGVALHVVDSGERPGRPILFIHGFSQSSLSWSRQLDSDLARAHRLVAMDLRGHGRSEKPRDAYGDSKLWADDVHAVIQALELDRPILSGWSYGPLVILDYIRHYGEDAIGGVQFVGGVSKLGNEQALAVISPAFLGLVPGFFSNDAAESVRSLEALLRLCCVKEPSAAEWSLMVGASVATPPHVRQALFARSLDNDDLLPKLRKPLLLTHGTDDRVIDPAVVEQHRRAIPHAEAHLMTGVGHAPFWDDAPAFNERLRRFSASV
jgi:pimeloyl-ACP methyl ester carboxylesterase